MNVKSKAYRGIIFDLDGVIFDSESLWQKAFLLANAEFSVELDEEYRQRCCGKDEQSIRAELREIYPRLDADRYRDFILSYVIETIEKKGADLKKGFCELISYLKFSGYKTALATSSGKERALKLFLKKNLEPYDIFDGLVFSEDVKVSKPNPEIFLLAARRMGLIPRECIVLEDSLNGILAAKLGGFASIMVKDLIEPDANAQQACLFIANDFVEVVKYLEEENEVEKNRY